MYLEDIRIEKNGRKAVTFRLLWWNQKKKTKTRPRMWLFFKFTTKNTKAVCQKKRDAYAHIKKLKLAVSLRDAPRKLRASRCMLRHAAAAEHTSYDIFILIALYVIQAQSHPMSSLLTRLTFLACVSKPPKIATKFCWNEYLSGW